MTDEQHLTQKLQPVDQHLEHSPRLLTKQQVMEALNAEIASSSLTAVAAKYGLSPQELSNFRSGRAGLSKRLLKQLSLRLHELYERMPRS